MNTLIIDCSAGMSVYLICGEKEFSKIDNNQKKHTDELLLCVDELLNQAKISVSEIEDLCVCVGPGSFTGIRVAISICKGLAVASKMKIFTATNFDILQAVKSEKVIYLLEGFSKFVYVRKIENGKVSDDCVDVNQLIDMVKNSNYDIYVQNEKMQNILKNAEILSNIAQNQIILHFLDKINNNQSVELNTIEPVYLRASQAEMERNKKLAGGK
ncbi:MAG: tRNA (adenosine(37)-N6)-threonylcarbamoyltransferase complex dimerization subunit type 1 TsaB [Clostridia bacterium]|nr:tRNA (adenosine(37)-N6)-threonylcarbamoyltransferase complex dimerization subunit type 1 TsaB [Clostridia bacterium]